MQVIEPPSIAVIDIGSNSIKILVANAVNGLPVPIFAATRETRIGAGISKDNPIYLKKLWRPLCKAFESFWRL